MQGVGASFLFVSACAIATERYKEQIELIMVLIKLSGGVGIVCGPSIGSAIYSKLGFKGPFLLFALVFLGIAILVLFFTSDAFLDPPPNEGCEASVLCTERSDTNYGSISGDHTVELRHERRLRAAESGTSFEP